MPKAGAALNSSINANVVGIEQEVRQPY